MSPLYTSKHASLPGETFIHPVFVEGVRWTLLNRGRLARPGHPVDVKSP